jgi:hypothetical protein
MEVIVEVIVFRQGERLEWRRVEGSIQKDERPDEAALRLLCLGDGTFDGMCHSTSWRYETDGQIVLTYAVVPDPDPRADATILSGDVIPASIDPLRPAPPNLRAEHIAVHAVHHLAELSRRDVTVKKQVNRYPQLWNTLREYAEKIDHNN